MRDYTLSEYQLISEYTAKYRKDIDNVKMECRHHLRNEVSALILERKFHDIEMRFRKERRNTMTKTVEVKKAYFIENHPNHPDLARVLDIMIPKSLQPRILFSNHSKILWLELQTLHNGVAIILCTLMKANSREPF